MPFEPIAPALPSRRSVELCTLPQQHSTLSRRRFGTKLQLLLLPLPIGIMLNSIKAATFLMKVKIVVKTASDGSLGMVGPFKIHLTDRGVLSKLLSWLLRKTSMKCRRSTW